MRILLSSEQKQFTDEVRAFTSQLEPEPLHDSIAEQFKFLVAFERRLQQAGLAAVAWPTAYGGRGLGPVEYAIVCDELGRARAPEVINIVGIDVIAPALLTYVEPGRLRMWLPAMASGDQIWCQLFSEPDAGSDLVSLRTLAEPDGAGWRITGQKVWCTWAQFAEWGLLLARTGPPESRHRGITAFVLEMSTTGIEVRPLRTMTGSAEFSEVFFDGARIPAGSVVGEVGGGWDVAQAMLTAERGPYAIRRSAILRAGLTGVHQLAVECKDPVLRQTVVHATIAMELLDLRIADMVGVLARGDEIGSGSALTKLLLGQVEQSIFSAAIDLLGLPGMASDGRDPDLVSWLERYLYSRAATIYGGTQQIQRNIVGERLLGLPR